MITSMDKNHGWKALIYLVGVFAFGTAAWLLTMTMIPQKATVLIALFAIAFLSFSMMGFICLIRGGLHLWRWTVGLWFPKEPEPIEMRTYSLDSMDAMFDSWKNEPEDWVDALWDWMTGVYDKVNSFYWNVRNGIKNLWIWKKVIWQDRQWDELFLYCILLKKLERIEYYRKYSPCYMEGANDAKVNRDIHTMILLIRRIDKDEYVGLSRSNKWIHNSKFPRMGPFEVPYKHEDFMEKQDKDLLFKLLSRRIRSFWD